MEKVTTAQAPILQGFNIPKSSNKKETMMMATVGVLVILAGIGTGWLLSGVRASGSSTAQAPKTAVKNDKEAGVADVSGYEDKSSPEGLLEKGGIDGEGTHHLTRPGGANQTVYISSTVLDLESFVGKKVKVWGETISGKKAGWLIDVVKVKVIE